MNVKRYWKVRLKPAQTWFIMNGGTAAEWANLSLRAQRRYERVAAYKAKEQAVRDGSWRLTQENASTKVSDGGSRRAKSGLDTLNNASDADAFTGGKHDGRQVAATPNGADRVSHDGRNRVSTLAWPDTCNMGDPEYPAHLFQP